MNDGRNHLHDVVNDFDVTMLVTHTTSAMHARPMAIACVDDGIGAYLVTKNDSLKIVELRANPNALLTFQNARHLIVRGVLAAIDFPNSISVSFSASGIWEFHYFSKPTLT